MQQIAEGIGKRPEAVHAGDQTAGASGRRMDHAMRRSFPRPASKANRAVRRKPVMTAKMPNFVEPQLAKLVDRPPDGIRLGA